MSIVNRIGQHGVLFVNKTHKNQNIRYIIYLTIAIFVFITIKFFSLPVTTQESYIPFFISTLIPFVIGLLLFFIKINFTLSPLSKSVFIGEKGIDSSIHSDRYEATSHNSKGNFYIQWKNIMYIEITKKSYPFVFGDYDVISIKTQNGLYTILLDFLQIAEKQNKNLSKIGIIETKILNNTIEIEMVIQILKHFHPKLKILKNH